MPGLVTLLFADVEGGVGPREADRDGDDVGVGPL